MEDRNYYNTKRKKKLGGNKHYTDMNFEITNVNTFQIVKER